MESNSLRTHKRRNAAQVFRSVMPYFGCLLIVVLFLILTKGAIFGARNLKALINSCFATIIGACGIMFVMSQGNFDLSISATMAFAGILAAKAAAVNVYLALPVALVTGLVIGAINSLLVVELGINSFLGTLAFSYVISGVSTVVLNSSGIGIPYSMLDWSSTGLRLAVVAVIVIVSIVVFSFTKYGRWCKATGASETAAFYSGVKTRLIKWSGFLIAGGIMGLLAFFVLIRGGTATTSMGGTLQFDALNALLIGGFPITGGANSNVRAPIIGSITVVILSSGMTLLGIPDGYQTLVRGLLFILIVTLTFDRKNVLVIK